MLAHKSFSYSRTCTCTFCGSCCCRCCCYSYCLRGTFPAAVVATAVSTLLAQGSLDCVNRKRQTLSGHAFCRLCRSRSRCRHRCLSFSFSFTQLLPQPPLLPLCVAPQKVSRSHLNLSVAARQPFCGHRQQCLKKGGRHCGGQALWGRANSIFYAGHASTFVRCQNLCYKNNNNSGNNKLRLVAKKVAAAACCACGSKVTVRQGEM